MKSGLFADVRRHIGEDDDYRGAQYRDPTFNPRPVEDRRGGRAGHPLVGPLVEQLTPSLGHQVRSPCRVRGRSLRSQQLALGVGVH